MDQKQFLLGMLQLIDVAAKRGTWNGEELEFVAVLRKEVVGQLKEFAEPEETQDLKEDPQPEEDE